MSRDVARLLSGAVIAATFAVLAALAFTGVYALWTDHWAWGVALLVLPVYVVWERLPIGVQRGSERLGVGLLHAIILAVGISVTALGLGLGVWKLVTGPGWSRVIAIPLLLGALHASHEVTERRNDWRQKRQREERGKVEQIRDL